MCFKRACIVFGFVFAAGCGGENEPFFEIPDLSLTKSSCLNDLTSQLDRYFSGDSTQKEVEELWNCADYAISTYMRYVRGTEPNGYKATDLRAFLEHFFLNDRRKSTKQHKISDELLEEAMQIKRLFVGGSRLMVTRDELTLTRQLIGEFKAMTLELLPHTKVLFKEHDKVLNPSHVDEALKSVDRVLERLFVLIGKQSVRYEFSRLKNLLLHLHEYFLQDDPESTFDDFALLVPVVAKLKGILLNTSPLEIGDREWPQAAGVISDLVRAAFRAKLSFKERELYAGTGVTQIRSTFNDIYQSLRRAFTRRSDRPIAMEELDGLIVELGRADLLLFDMESDDFSRVIGRVVDFVLNPQNRFPASGLTVEKLDYLFNEVGNWGDVQEVIVGVRRPEQANDYNDMKLVLESPWPLGLDAHQRIMMDGDTARPLDVGAKSRLNWARVIFRLLIRAYVRDSERLGKRQLKIDEVRVAITDLKPVLVGLNLMDPDDEEFDERLFRDANLFMPRSNGDRTLGYYELIEYLHYVYSGISAGDFFINRVPAHCFDLDRMFAPCFRERFQTDSALSLEHLSLFWSQYASHSDDKRWTRDMNNLDKVNRAGMDPSQPITKTDIYENYILLQYIETVMLRFDEDRSGQLDLRETLAALNHFKGVFGDLLGMKDDQIDSQQAELEALFTYLVKFGEMPYEEPISALRYLNWKWDRAQWSISADRGTLLQIVAVLASL